MGFFGEFFVAPMEIQLIILNLPFYFSILDWKVLEIRVWLRFANKKALHSTYGHMDMKQFFLMLLCSYHVINDPHAPTHLIPMKYLTYIFMILTNYIGT
jgi:hypothetical protein